MNKYQKIKQGKKSNRGGRREGAGRKPGESPKTQIAITVDEAALKTAMAVWKGTRSALFNALLLEHLANLGKAD